MKIFFTRNNYYCLKLILLGYSRKVQHFEEKTSTPKSATLSTQRPRSLHFGGSSNDSSTLPLSCELAKSSRYSVTDFPCNSDTSTEETRRTRSKSEYAANTKDAPSVKRSLIHSTSVCDGTISEAEVSQIVEMQDSLLEDLGDTKEVLAKLQHLVSNGNYFV